MRVSDLIKDLKKLPDQDAELVVHDHADRYLGVRFVRLLSTALERTADENVYLELYEDDGVTRPDEFDGIIIEIDCSL